MQVGLRLSPPLHRAPTLTACLPSRRSLLLASRGIVEGIKHVDKLFVEEDDTAVIKKRVSES